MAAAATTGVRSRRPEASSLKTPAVGGVTAALLAEASAAAQIAAAATSASAAAAAARASAAEMLLPGNVAAPLPVVGAIASGVHETAVVAGPSAEASPGERVPALKLLRETNVEDGAGNMQQQVLTLVVTPVASAPASQPPAPRPLPALACMVTTMRPPSPKPEIVLPAPAPELPELPPPTPASTPPLHVPPASAAMLSAPATGAVAVGLTSQRVGAIVEANAALSAAAATAPDVTAVPVDTRLTGSVPGTESSERENASVASSNSGVTGVELEGEGEGTLEERDVTPVSPLGLTLPLAPPRPAAWSGVATASLVGATPEALPSTVQSLAPPDFATADCGNGAIARSEAAGDSRSVITPRRLAAESADLLVSGLASDFSAAPSQTPRPTGDPVAADSLGDISSFARLPAPPPLAHPMQPPARIPLRTASPSGVLNIVDEARALPTHAALTAALAAAPAAQQQPPSSMSQSPRRQTSLPSTGSVSLPSSQPQQQQRQSACDNPPVLGHLSSQPPPPTVSLSPPSPASAPSSPASARSLTAPESPASSSTTPSASTSPASPHALDAPIPAAPVSASTTAPVATASSGPLIASTSPHASTGDSTSVSAAAVLTDTAPATHAPGALARSSAMMAAVQDEGPPPPPPQTQMLQTPSPLSDALAKVPPYSLPTSTATRFLPPNMPRSPPLLSPLVPAVPAPALTLAPASNSAQLGRAAPEAASSSSALPVEARSLASPRVSITPTLTATPTAAVVQLMGNGSSDATQADPAERVSPDRLGSNGGAGGSGGVDGATTSPRATLPPAPRRPPPARPPPPPPTAGPAGSLAGHPASPAPALPDVQAPSGSDEIWHDVEEAGMARPVDEAWVARDEALRDEVATAAAEQAAVYLPQAQGPAPSLALVRSGTPETNSGPSSDARPAAARRPPVRTSEADVHAFVDALAAGAAPLLRAAADAALEAGAAVGGSAGALTSSSPLVVRVPARTLTEEYHLALMAPPALPPAALAAANRAFVLRAAAAGDIGADAAAVTAPAPASLSEAARAAAAGGLTPDQAAFHRLLFCSVNELLAANASRYRLLALAHLRREGLPLPPLLPPPPQPPPRIHTMPDTEVAEADAADSDESLPVLGVVVPMRLSRAALRTACNRVLHSTAPALAPLAVGPFIVGSPATAAPPTSRLTRGLLLPPPARAMPQSTADDGTRWRLSALVVADIKSQLGCCVALSQGTIGDLVTLLPGQAPAVSAVPATFTDPHACPIEAGRDIDTDACALAESVVVGCTMPPCPQCPPASRGRRARRCVQCSARALVPCNCDDVMAALGNGDGVPTVAGIPLGADNVECILSADILTEDRSWRDWSADERALLGEVADGLLADLLRDAFVVAFAGAAPTRGRASDTAPALAATLVQATKSPASGSSGAGR